MSEQVQTTKAVPSILDKRWDVVLSNVVAKTALGAGVGIVASVLFFKRRASVSYTHLDVYKRQLLLWL